MFKAFIWCFVVLQTLTVQAKSVDSATKETDILYKTLIQSVVQFNFDLMASTYHQDAVLVTPKKTTAISNALKRWRNEGLKLKDQGGSATLSFRFSSRVINNTTAFEKGIYRYSTISKEGIETVYYAHFEDLNVKKGNTWLTLMENQTQKATLKEWNKLSTKDSI